VESCFGILCIIKHFRVNLLGVHVVSRKLYCCNQNDDVHQIIICFGSNVFSTFIDVRFWFLKSSFVPFVLFFLPSSVSPLSGSALLIKRRSFNLVLAFFNRKYGDFSMLVGVVFSMMTFFPTVLIRDHGIEDHCSSNL
jgi:hypothetical protein